MVTSLVSLARFTAYAQAAIEYENRMRQAYALEEAFSEFAGYYTPEPVYHLPDDLDADLPVRLLNSAFRGTETPWAQKMREEHDIYIDARYRRGRLGQRALSRIIASNL